MEEENILVVEKLQGEEKQIVQVVEQEEKGSSED